MSGVVVVGEGGAPPPPPGPNRARTSVPSPCSIERGRPIASSLEYPVSWTHPGDTESMRYGDCPSVIAWTTPPQCCSVLPTRVDWHEVARRAATSTSGVANDSEELCVGGGARRG